MRSFERIHRVRVAHAEVHAEVHVARVDVGLLVAVREGERSPFRELPGERRLQRITPVDHDLRKTPPVCRDAEPQRHLGGEEERLREAHARLPGGPQVDRIDVAENVA